MKKLFTLLLALAASVGTLFAQSGTCGNNLTWDLTDGVLTISGTGDMTNWFANSNAPWYSYREEITDVIIDNGVTTIGSYAFYNCTSLTSVSIPNSVFLIEINAFLGCSSLTSVTLNSSSITSEGYGWNSNLGTIFGGNVTEFIIGDSVTAIGSNAFNYCTSLTSVTIGNSVTSIGRWAFENCTGLTSIEIPNSVTTIGGSAFNNCTSLTSVTIGNSVTSIEQLAFISCSGLTSITCNAVVPPICGGYVFYGVDKSIPLYVPDNSVEAYQSADGWREFYNIIGQSNAPTAIEEVNTTTNLNCSRKLLQDGQILILRGEKTYSLTGAEVK